MKEKKWLVLIYVNNGGGEEWHKEWWNLRAPAGSIVCTSKKLTHFCVPSVASVVFGLKHVRMCILSRYSVWFTADLLANKRWYLVHLQVFSVFYLFHIAVLFLRSQDVIRGERESEPGTWRSQHWRSAEKLSESGYSSSSQLGKEEKH